MGIPASNKPAVSKPRGLSLVEILVTLAVLAIAVGAALASFSAMAENRHLQGTAAQFEADVAYARDAAELRSQTVRLSFLADAADARCWLVHVGEPQGCRCDAATGAAACDAPTQLLRAYVLGADTPLRLSSNAPSLRFSAPRHTVTPSASLTLTARSGRGVKEIVSVVGRVRGCSPDGAVPGFTAC
ncbi:GspH/FimT family pseudopilin [Azohydromonas lata]|uniref:GspH/FimT family pseudopilin n=1 Tax=Azohydromonas lata TaxID=45677 RepID=UPI000A073E38|nr:GspH/FimT family pseudopilin [Azohydromonas lata]